MNPRFPGWLYLLCAPALCLPASGDVLITEFVAASNTEFLDEDGDAADWIEIQNVSETAASVRGWSLTDDPADPGRWQLPDLVLAPGAYVVVVASAKDRGDPRSELHTNFKLSAGGEYLALTRPSGAVAHEFAPAYPPQTEGFSYGLTAGGEERFFRDPTPGAPNRGAVVDFVADTKFSHDRGFYREPFAVAITTETAGAEVRYTLDGSAPTAATGTLYTSPIAVETTSVLRAAAFKDGFEPTDVDTQTYIFPAHVLGQTAPDGYPARWSGLQADYAMDPRIADDPLYEGTIGEALESLPTISLVMDVDHLFGPRGIYQNPTQSGAAWERPMSVELIPAALDMGPATGFQARGGARIHGNRSRDPASSPKHGFRLVFRGAYGAKKLEFRLFPDSPVEEFDTLVIRPNAFDSWVSDDAGQRRGATYLRDEWVRSAQRATGRLAVHSLFVHLYLNGLYWGLYNLTERPDGSFGESYLGGDKESYDVVKNHEEVVDGNIAAYRRLDALRAQGVRGDAEYEQIREYVDVQNLADYMIVNMFAPSTDWPGNYYMLRNRDSDGGFRFLSWDSEYAFLGSVDNNRTVAHWRDADSPTKFYHALRENAEFRLLFADHLRRHFFDGGILTPEAAIERWRGHAATIEAALVTESARWGDYRRATPYRPEREWRAESDRLLTQYLPRRSAIVLDQFREQGMYPDLAAPRFRPPGGVVPAGTRLSISGEAGTVYYTLDGRDPRLPGGGLSPDALVAGAPPTDTLLAAGVPARLIVPVDDSPGLEWTRPEFDDSEWDLATSAIGYERSSGFEDDFSTDTEERMHGVSTSVFLRVPFEVEDPAEWGLLALRVKYDDGFVAYLNGERVASRNAPEDVDWNSRATASHSDSEAETFLTFDITPGLDALRAGTNLLALHGLNASVTSSDFLLVSELGAGRPTDFGTPLATTTLVKARALQGDTWSALTEAVFIVDAPSPLRVTEIMYHPAETPEDGPYAADDFEFIELQNIAGEPLALTGTTFADGIDFDFTSGGVAVLGPGAVVLVVRNLAAFESRYDSGGMRIAGEYSGSLRNSGETILLRDARGETVLEFAYDDAWHPETDGAGASLTIADVLAPVSTWGQPGSWSPSRAAGGTPGVHTIGAPPAGGLQRVGDANQDGSVDVADAVSFLLLLFGHGGPRFPCGGDSITMGGNRELLDANGDDGVDVSDAVHLLGYLFASGPPPARGPGCVRIEGCGDLCPDA